MFTIIKRIITWIVFVIILLLVFFRVSSFVRESQDPRTASGLFFEVADTFIHYQEYGSGQPVILVHGTGSWGEMWEETSNYLASVGYKVYAIDLPPFGYSGKDKSLDYSRRWQGERILQFVKGLNIEKPIIVGHSFGAGPVMEAVIAHPEFFGGIVLVDPALGVEAKTTVFNKVMSVVFQIPVVGPTLTSAILTNPFLTKISLASLLYNKAAADAHMVEVLQAPMKTQGTTEAVSQWFAEFLGEGENFKSKTAEEIKKVALPSAIMWGSRDTITPLSQGVELHALMPEAEFVVISEAGHIPQIENVSNFNMTLLNILNNEKAKFKK